MLLSLIMIKVRNIQSDVSQYYATLTGIHSVHFTPFSY